MRKNSIWKKLILLSFGSILALHINVASAQDDSTSVKTSTNGEECVITDDQI